MAQYPLSPGDKGFWDYVQQMYFPLSGGSVPPQTATGMPQGAEAPQTNINELNAAAAGTGQLPAAGGTVNVSGDGSATPVIPPIANPYADPQYRAMQEQMYGKIQDSIAAQKLSEQDAQKLLKDYLGQEQAMDLSPLLAWVDSSYGTNLQRGYQKPMTREERMLKAADLQDILRKAGAGVTEKELELLRAKMGDKKSEAEILANMQYRRELLAAQKNKSKTDPSNMTFKQRDDMKQDWLKTEGAAIRGLSRIKDASNRAIERLGKMTKVDMLDSGLKSAFADLVVNYNSQVAKLGALAGADLQLLQEATKVPKGMLDAWLQERLGTRTKEDMIKILKDIADKADFTVNYAGNYTNEITRPVYENVVGEYKGYSTISTREGANDPRIDAFMKKNNITDRDEAIKILKGAGKI